MLACKGGGKAESEMYEASELAEVMRNMLDDYEKSKHKLEDKKLVLSHVDYFEKIVTAEPTDSNDINDLYMSLARTFIDVAEDYSQTTDSLPNQIKMHNATVGACISCHNHFCEGPVSAIKKLYVSGH